jgi:hypothetical protein
MQEEKSEILIESSEPERHYLSVYEQSKWIMDWNMLLYQPEEESGFKLDWNKLIYNDEQMAEFNLQKQEKMIQPDKYEYLFENITQRTPMELYYLKMAGYDVPESINDDIEDQDDSSVLKRLIVQDKLTTI